MFGKSMEYIRGKISETTYEKNMVVANVDQLLPQKLSPILTQIWVTKIPLWETKTRLWVTQTPMLVTQMLLWTTQRHSWIIHILL